MIKTDKLIVGLHGYPGAGKDELAKRLVEQHGFQRIGFADPMRQAALALNPRIYVTKAQMEQFPVLKTSLYLDLDGGDALFRLEELVRVLGWTRAKLIPEVREWLQRQGTEAGRHIFGNNVWIDTAFKKIIESSGDKWVITDARFDNEAMAILGLPNGYIINIIRPGHGAVNSHASEQPLPRNYFAYTVHNTGTIQDLYNDADMLVASLDAVDPAMIDDRRDQFDEVREEFITTFGAVQARHHGVMRSKGFWKGEQNQGEKVALIHSELSEALEAIRSGYPRDPKCPEFGNLEVELSDAVLRIMDFAEAYQLPVAQALLAKLEYNATRPHKHGKSF
jgi:NTP pyrophosphatase (non-canonical NTP hydrolase)